MKKMIFALITIAFLYPNSVNAMNNVTIYYFHGEGCSHCAQMDVCLDEITQKNNNIKIIDYEVWYNEPNKELMKSIKSALTSKNIDGVPFVVLGNNYTVGYSLDNCKKINNYVDKYSNDEYYDYVGKFINGEISEIPENTTTSSLEEELNNSQEEQSNETKSFDYKYIVIFGGIIAIIIILYILKRGSKNGTL